MSKEQQIPLRSQQSSSTSAPADPTNHVSEGQSAGARRATEAVPKTSPGEESTQAETAKDTESEEEVDSPSANHTALAEPLDIPTTSVQKKRSVVVETLLVDCIRLLANFTRNYTSGRTRHELQMPRPKHDALSAQLERCEPVIYGGAAYAILHQALAKHLPDNKDTTFRPTTDIDVHCPFPYIGKRTKGWQQFTCKSATRAFEVAQDRVLEMVELLNNSSQQHVQALREQGITLHHQAACASGLIDFNSLAALARKRPSSRYDQIFPTLGGAGPFFTSCVYNEMAMFYTYKVCYVWSAQDVAMGEPQYAELIELQMMPSDVTALKNAKALFDVRLSESLNTSEWPSLDGEKEDSHDSAAEEKRSAALALTWSANQTSRKADAAKARMLLEDPRVLAEKAGLAVTNRLGRGCCKDGDWEKVCTDEHRARWLQSVAETKAFEKLGLTSSVLRETAAKCVEVIGIRPPKA